jgi:hypothetical protein
VQTSIQPVDINTRTRSSWLPSLVPQCSSCPPVGCRKGPRGGAKSGPTAVDHSSAPKWRAGDAAKGRSRASTQPPETAHGTAPLSCIRQLAAHCNHPLCSSTASTYCRLGATLPDAESLEGLLTSSVVAAAARLAPATCHPHLLKPDPAPSSLTLSRTHTHTHTSIVPVPASVWRHLRLSPLPRQNRHDHLKWKWLSTQDSRAPTPRRLPPPLPTRTAA